MQKLSLKWGMHICKLHMQHKASLSVQVIRSISDTVKSGYIRFIVALQGVRFVALICPSSESGGFHVTS